MLICVFHLHRSGQWKLLSDWIASPPSEPTSAGCWRIQSAGQGGPEGHTGKHGEPQSHHTFPNNQHLKLQHFEVLVKNRINKNQSLPKD